MTSTASFRALTDYKYDQRAPYSQGSKSNNPPRTLMADESWSVPTPVQEVAAGVVEPPSQFVLQEQDRPGNQPATDMPEPIPMIDLSRLTEADEAAKLQSALQSWGLFLVSCSVPYLSLCIMIETNSYLHSADYQPWDRRISGGRCDGRISRFFPPAARRETEIQ